jgi:FtsH-binding integral membrane protein
MADSWPRYAGVSYGAGPIVRTGAERLTLIRRTYALVFAGVLVSALGVVTSWTQPRIMDAVMAHYFLAFVLPFAPLLMAQWKARVFPANIGFTFLFTFLEGIALGPFLALAERGQPGILGEAALLTGAAFGTLTIYAFVSRRDFSAWFGFFFTGLVVVLLAGLLNAFVLHSAGVDLWLAGAIVLVFTGLLVFDTWRLRNVYGPDDYIPAAINIYLDLLNLFLAIVRLLSGNRRN